MTWWTATSVTVTNGSTVVSVNTGDDIQIAQEAGGLIIGTNPPVEIKRTYLDGTSAKKIELRQPWPYANQSAQPALAFPTDADLAEATRVLREVASDFDAQPNGSTVALRTSNGRLKVTNATESNDAVALGQAVTLTGNQEINGIKNFNQPIKITGKITAGSASSINGTNILSDNYGGESLTNIGTIRSSGGTIIGNAIKQGEGVEAFVSSTNIPFPRSAILLESGTVRILTATGSQVAENASVLNLQERLYLDPIGNFRTIGAGNLFTFNTYNAQNTSSAISIGALSTNAGGTAGSGVIRVYHDHANTISSSIAFEVNGGQEMLRINSTGTIVANNNGSYTDTTAGRLLKVGDFGLGATGATTVFSGSLNTLFAGGFYACGPSATGGPAGVSIDGAKVQVIKWADGNSCTQIFHSYNGDTYERNITGGTLLAWKKTFSSSNILGAVSQSAGVPTGGIIERGSNANGKYVRFADGTQICTKVFTVATDINIGVGSVFSSPTIQWNYPITFSLITSCVTSGNSDSGVIAGLWAGTRFIGSSYSNLVLFSATSVSAGSANFGVIAIGRWF